jgi:hypothetical protein
MNGNILGLIITLGIFGGILFFIYIGNLIHKYYLKNKEKDVSLYSPKYPFITIVEEYS